MAGRPREWRPIEEFPDYEVSFDGQVRNVGTYRYFSSNQNQNGSVNVKFYVNGEQFTRAVDLLVANAFLEPHPMEAFNESVIHLDGDLGNCNAANLMWRPRWFKMAYQKQFRKDGPTIKYPVYCVDTDERFENSRQASMTHGVLDKDICMNISNGPSVWPHGFNYEIDRE